MHRTGILYKLSSLLVIGGVVGWVLLPQPTAAQPQGMYWVQLTDKAQARAQPAQLLHPATLARRQHLGLPLLSPDDLPLAAPYLAALRRLTDSLWMTSRWFNAVALQATARQMAAVRQLPFVSAVTCLQANLRPRPGTPNSLVSAASASAKGPPLKATAQALVEGQIGRMQGDLCAQLGLTGKGVRIAVLDIGFRGARQARSLHHLFANQQIESTYDFAHHKEKVYHGTVHGTGVLSCIAGRVTDSLPIGLAPDATFLLAITEKGMFEPAVEQLFWIQALEWAEQQGAHIVSSSVGYTSQRYFYPDADGHSTLLTQAANRAAAKGLLVVNAAGNAALDAWEHIAIPADGDSVLCIGATNPYTDVKADYSSYGPTFNRRLKPNLCAYGTVLCSHGPELAIVSGTSYSAPLVVGLAACALQQQPQRGGMALFRALEQAGHLWPYADYAHGYGIPQASKLLQLPPGHPATPQPVPPTLSYTRQDNALVVRVHNVPPPGIIRNLYYHIQTPRGDYRYFAVVRAEQADVLRIPLTRLQAGETVRFHYEGYTTQYTVGQE